MEILKAPNLEGCLAYPRNSNKTSMAEVKRARKRTIGAEFRDTEP